MTNTVSIIVEVWDCVEHPKVELVVKEDTPIHKIVTCLRIRLKRKNLQLYADGDLVDDNEDASVLSLTGCYLSAMSPMIA